VTGLAGLLLLADGRYPAGGHAHSGGLEAAVSAGRVTDLASLGGFLAGRLATAGLVAASFSACSAAACTGCGSPGPGLPGPGLPGAGSAAGGSLGALAGGLAELEAGLDARTASPALRLASRRQGRALLRAGRATWPWPGFDALRHDPHQPVALGVTAAAAGLTPEHAALAAAYGVLSGPAAAAVRLLALDPYPVQRLLAALATDCDAIAAEAAGHVDRPVAELPAATAPLADIAAEHHASPVFRTCG
jgi:urease accessory protein